MSDVTAAKPPTILVIDDDAEIRYSLARVLSSHGFQVIEAPNGEQGVALVKKGPAPKPLPWIKVTLNAGVVTVDEGTTVPHGTKVS